MSDDRRSLRFTFDRTVTGERDLDDPDAQRAWCSRRVESQVLLGGTLAEELVLFRAGEILATSLDGVVDLGEESLLVVAHRKLGEDGVLGRFRLGARVVPGPAGPRRAACLLSLDSEGPGWSAWWRCFGRTPEGVGTWHGDWQELAGSGVEDAPEWLLEWLDPGKAEAGGQRMEDTGEPPEVDMRAAYLPAPAALPEDPRGLAHALHASLDQELVARGLDAVLVFVFRPERLERWEIRDTGPFVIDDLVRAACAMGESLAVALVHLGNALMPDGRSLPAVMTVVHLGDKLGRRVLPFELRDGRPHPLPPHYPPLEDIEEAWIGVEPRVPLSLTALAPKGAPEA